MEIRYNVAGSKHPTAMHSSCCFICNRLHLLVSPFYVKKLCSFTKKPACKLFALAYKYSVSESTRSELDWPNCTFSLNS